MSSPNILVVYTDDQGYGDWSDGGGASLLETPNLARLAAEGMVFTDGHSAASVCSPSRYALLTGRYPWRTAGGDRVVGADLDCLIEDERTTVASFLRDRGYATALFGKWHLGMQIPGTKGDRDWARPVTDGPLDKGFDTFFGIPASMNYGVLTWFDGAYATEPASLWTRKKFPAAEITTRPLDYRMAPPYEAEQLHDSDIEVAPGFRDEDALAIITERTVAYIESERREPFFVYVAFTSPHLPHCTAPAFRGTSRVGNYGDFLRETDHRVGQILDALDGAGIADETLVLFTSDNGPENNRKDWLHLYGHDPAGGLRGGKRDIHEGGHRVPFLVRWPGVVSPGSRCDVPVGQVDLLATVADLFGDSLGSHEGEDSRSFLPELEGRARPRPPLLHRARGRFAIREGRWKLVFGPAKDQLGEPVALYDLDEDRAESRDVRGEQPDVVERLHRAAAEMIGSPLASSGVSEAARQH